MNIFLVFGIRKVNITLIVFLFPVAGIFWPGVGTKALFINHSLRHGTKWPVP